MNRLSTPQLVGLGLAVVVLNALILLLVIPALSRHLGQFYNENQYADGYDEIASNLVTGNGYRFRPDTAETLQREPGYPLLLAGIFFVFGQNFVAVKIANILLACGAALLMTRIADRVSNSQLLMIAAPLIFLFHPGTLIAESRGGSEILFALFLALFILTVYRAIDSGRWWDYLVSGIVLGFTVLVRSTPVLFPLVLFCYLFVFLRKSIPPAQLFRNIAVMILAMVTIQSPWIIRNYRLTGKFVPTASVLGIAAQTGYYLSTHHPIGNLHIDREAAWERNRLAAQQGYKFKDGYYQYFYSSNDELTFSQFLFKRVLNEYKKSPLLFVKVVGINIFNFWCGGRTGKSVAMDAAVQFPLLILAIVGVVLAVKSGEFGRVAIPSLMIVYIIGISVPILALARYSVPVIPFVAILAGYTLVAAHRRFHLESKLESQRSLLASA